MEQQAPPGGRNSRGHGEIVGLLLTAGTNPNFASDSGHAPLIAAGADVEAVDIRYHTTALHIASSRGHQAAVQRLLDGGADPFIQTFGGMTPRDDVRRRGLWQIETNAREAEQRRVR